MEKTMQRKNDTLNEVLADLGYTTEPTKYHRKNILQGGIVVLADATANETWIWLNGWFGIKAVSHD